MQGTLSSFLSRWRSFPLRKTASLPLFALALAGCSTVSLDTPYSGSGNSNDSRQVHALRQLTAQQDRLYQVSAPLLLNNTDLCRSNVRKLIGFTAKTRYSYSDEFADAASTLGLQERLQVTGVLKHSGAAQAGVQRGDILMAVENQPLPQGRDAERQAAIMLGPIVSSLSSVRLGILRNGTAADLNVPLTSACGFGIELGNVDSVSAYADGRRVLITRGMLNFVRNDTELAYVLAREMAHNALGHAARQRVNATIGAIIDNMSQVHPDISMLSGSGGVLPFPQDLDAAADTIALYMAARAGYNVDGAAAFWQRLAAQYPASVTNSYTALHPATSARLIAIRKAAADIKAKQASRQPLLP